jgi:hypothetical protein
MAAHEWLWATGSAGASLRFALAEPVARSGLKVEDP